MVGVALGALDGVGLGVYDKQGEQVGAAVAHADAGVAGQFGAVSVAQHGPGGVLRRQAEVGGGQVVGAQLVFEPRQRRRGAADDALFQAGARRVVDDGPPVAPPQFAARRPQ